MITTCWNCQGVGNNLAVRHLEDILGQYHPQVLFLSETKQQRRYMETLCENQGFFNLHTVEPQGLSGGLALLWKEEVSVEILSSSIRWIDSKIQWQNKTFYLTGVYGDPVVSEREYVWEFLIRLGENRDAPWLMLGDFNELLNNDEKRGGRLRPENSFYAFRNMLIKCGMLELPHVGNHFSWFGNRNGELIHCKLDRILANVDWYINFPAAIYEYLPRIGSDHSPVLLKCNGEGHYRKGQFRYDSRWSQKQGLLEAVQMGWNANVNNQSDIVGSIRQCRSAMAKWKKSQTPIPGYISKF